MADTNDSGFPLRRSTSSSLRKSKDTMKKSMSNASLASSDSNFEQDEDMDDVGDSVSEMEDNNDWFEEEEQEEEEPTFTILPKDGIVKTQQETIEGVMSQVNLSAADTAILLQHFLYVWYQTSDLHYYWFYVLMIAHVGMGDLSRYHFPD